MSARYVCVRCSYQTSLRKTDFSIFSREKNIVIKNYPLEVCSFCGNIEVKKDNIKKTMTFLKIQRHKFLYKKIFK